MNSRYANSNETVLTNPTNPSSSAGSSSQSSQQSSSSNSFTGITDPNALAALQTLISQLASGGTEADKKTSADRKQTIADTRATAADYTKDKAFSDAAALISQSLQNSLEKNMPAISRSIQGAGTSASSMQGLLSQKLATDSAQAAGALGAEQAKAYGSISTQLANVLENLTKADPTLANALTNALSLFKNTTSSSTSQGTSVGASQQSSSGGGGGGSRLASQKAAGETSGQYDWAAADAEWRASRGGDRQQEVYLVYDTQQPHVWANYTGEGTQGTSTELPSGYMDVRNTTNDSGSSDEAYYD